MTSEQRMPNLLLTVDEVADALRMSKGFVKKLIAAGGLRSVKVGTSRRVKADDLLAYVEHLSTGGETPSAANPPVDRSHT